MFDDADALPETYDEWLKLARKTAFSMKRRGFTIRKVVIDPKIFPEWCKARGMKLDGAARSQYCAGRLAGKWL